MLRRRFLLGASAFGAGAIMSSGLEHAAAEQPGANPRPRWALALHGGAGTEPDKMTADERSAMEKSLAEALAIGSKLLESGKPALDAVEQVIRHLEDDPQFNAGKGAVFHTGGGHELDASIMDGATKACGAVAAVRTVKNPITLSRLVMSKTRHVLLIGNGAEEFADVMQVERVKNDYFSTDKQRARFEAYLQRQKEQPKAYKGTVGCVALDAAGNLAAGTSTGGVTGKRFGRVGDSPIVGAGTYADNASVAVSCTGTGEEFIRHAVAYDISARLLYKNQSLPDAVEHVLRKTLQPDDGGLIALSRTGQIVMDFTTDGMARAAADANGLQLVKLGK